MSGASQTIDEARLALWNPDHFTPAEVAQAATAILGMWPISRDEAAQAVNCLRSTRKLMADAPECATGGAPSRSGILGGYRAG